jgi:hypothetical protein
MGATQSSTSNKTRCDAPSDKYTPGAEIAPPKMPGVESFESKAYRKVRLLCTYLQFAVAVRKSVLLYDPCSM